MAHEEPKTDDPTTWPPPQYRDWVQTQIANKMLLRISGLGIVSVVVLVASYFLAQNFVLDNIRPKIETTVYKRITGQTKVATQNEVLRQLAGYGDLVNALKERVTKKDHLDDILKSKEFTDQATARLVQMFADTNLVQGVVLTEALKGVRAEEAPAATRALGLQLYAVLYGAASTAATLPPIRETFVEFIARESRNGILTPRLSEVILEHYPLGDCPAPGDKGQGTQPSPCHDADASVVAAILKVLAKDSRSEVDQALLETFFSRLPLHLVSDVLVWMDSHPAAKSNNTLLAGLLSSKNHPLATATVSRIASYVEDRDKSELRSRILTALGKLDPMAPIDRQSRRNALGAIWRGAQISELKQAFSFEALNTRSATETSDRVRSRTIRRSPRREVVVLRSAVLALLRTAKPKESELNNDWDNVLRAELLQDSRGATRDYAYVAWAMRMRRDKEDAHDISWAADKLLEAEFSDPLNNPLPSTLTAFAIRHISRGRFEETSRNLGKSSATGGKPTPPMAVTRSIILRDAEGPAPFRWLKSIFEPNCDDVLLCDHVLAALGEPADKTNEATYRQRVILALKNPHPQKSVLIAIVLPHLLQRATRPEHRWDIVAAVEGLYYAARKKTVKDLPAPILAQVKQTFPWIGSELHPSHGPLQLGPFPKSLDLTPDQRYRDGGQWYRILVGDDLMVTVDGLQPGIELVFMDADRSVVTARRQPAATPRSFGVFLHEGEHTLAVRLSSTSSSIPTLRLSADHKPVPITSEKDYDSPVDSSRDYIVTFVPGANAVDLPISLGKGSVLNAETGRLGRELSVDTELGVLDATKERQLAFDDDSGAGWFSKLTYESDRKQEVVLRVSTRNWGTRNQKPRKFKLGVVIAHNIGDAASDTFTVPRMKLGERLVVRVRTNPPRLRLLVPTSGVYRLRHEHPFHTRLLVDSQSDRPVKPVGSDTAEGFFKKWFETWFFLESEKEYLMELREATRPEVFLTITKQGVLVVDFDGKDDPETVLDASTAAVVRVPATGAVFDMTAAHGSRTSVLHVYGVDEEQLDAVVTELRPATRPSAVDAVVRSYEGWTRIEWPSVEDFRYRVHISPKDVDGPISVINGITVDVGHGWTQPGDWVRLGQHEMLSGYDNWNAQMGKYVGCIARITSLADKDRSGSTLATVALNYPQEERRWFWRTRHMQRVPLDTTQPERCLPYTP